MRQSILVRRERREPDSPWVVELTTGDAREVLFSCADQSQAVAHACVGAVFRGLNSVTIDAGHGNANLVAYLGQQPQEKQA